MASNLFWISAAQVVKDLGDGPHSAATLLARYGWTFARADASTCATYIDKNGVVQTAVAGALRVQYEDLNADGVRESPGLLLEGSRIQLVSQPENFGHADWTVWAGTPTLTSGQTDPFGGTGAYQIDDNNAASPEGIQNTVAFTADGTKAISLHVRAGTATKNTFGLFDNTAAAWRAQVDVTWTAGVPTAAIVTGGGTVYPIQKLTGGWYRILVSVNSVVAANSNRLLIYGAEASASAPVGTTFIFGANADNTAFPASYLRSAVTRAADSLTLPYNFGPQDLTLLARTARPVHADVVGATAGAPAIALLGTVAPRLLCDFAAAARNAEGYIDTPTTDQNNVVAIPAGAELKWIFQFKTLSTGGKVAVDVGSGLSAFSGAATAFSAFGDQTLRVGSTTVVGNELYGVLLDLKGRPGLVTLADMQIEPSFAPANPFEITDFDLPGPLISKSQSGRVNTRSIQQIGRTWTERYLLQMSQVSHKEFLARLKQYWRNGTIFAHSHVDYLTPKGVGGGFPLVKGASQTGSTLIVDGCPINTSNWLRAGDIFRVQALPQAFECAADVNTEGDGRALIPLVVPIFTGGSPADNATLTITGVTLDVVLLEPPDWPTTSGHSSDWGELVLSFSEAL